MNTTDHAGMSAVALGTGGGPIVSATRAGTSTLIRVDGASYVVDCGLGSIRNYRRHAGWESLAAVFLTHHHSDHVYDLGAYLVTGWHVPGESFAAPIEVVGPAAAASSDPAVPATTATSAMVAALLDGVFASDIAVRRVDEGRAPLHEWIRSRDIALPAELGADLIAHRHPEMAPIEVFRDDRVAVTATLVDHRRCFPAYAFRFDSAHGSVVVSGDTAPSANLVRLAAGADLLIHEAIDLDAILATLPDGPRKVGIEHHLRESHTPAAAAGRIAAEAGVGALVLNHIVPNTPGSVDLDALRADAAAQFDGPVRVAEDNDVLALPGDRATAAVGGAR